MPLRYQARITRRDLWDFRETKFVFGDNLARYGTAGLAGECRGEPNAVGVPTKRAPGQEPRDYFTDEDFAAWHEVAMPRLAHLAEHLRAGGSVVWPAAGIGTGLAELPARAPRIWNCLERARARLDALGSMHAAPAAAPIAAIDHPLVRKVLAAFPGARVVSVTEPEPDQPPAWID